MLNRYFKAARRILSASGVVIAGLENDETVRLNKSVRRPVNTLDERMQLVGALRSVNLVFGYPDTPRYGRNGLCGSLACPAPTVLVAASWDPHRDKKKWQTEQAGVQLALVEYKHENSTTRMLRHIGYEE